jgi:transposase
VGFEVLSRRRKWSADEKAALLAEVDAAGGKVAMIARRHGVSESLLHNWRSALKAAATSTPAPEPMEFVPLGIFGGSVDDRSATAPRSVETAPPARSRADDCAGVIEIELPNGARVRVDAFVNEKALWRVFRAMSGLR